MSTAGGFLGSFGISVGAYASNVVIEGNDIAIAAPNVLPPPLLGIDTGTNETYYYYPYSGYRSSAYGIYQYSSAPLFVADLNRNVTVMRGIVRNNVVYVTQLTEAATNEPQPYDDFNTTTNNATSNSSSSGPATRGPIPFIAPGMIYGFFSDTGSTITAATSASRANGSSSSASSLATGGSTSGAVQIQNNTVIVVDALGGGVAGFGFSQRMQLDDRGMFDMSDNVISLSSPSGNAAAARWSASLTATNQSAFSFTGNTIVVNATTRDGAAGGLVMPTTQISFGSSWNVSGNVIHAIGTASSPLFTLQGAGAQAKDLGAIASNSSMWINSNVVIVYRARSAGSALNFGAELTAGIDSTVNISSNVFVALATADSSYVSSRQPSSLVNVADALINYAGQFVLDGNVIYTPEDICIGANVRIESAASFSLHNNSLYCAHVTNVRARMGEQALVNIDHNTVQSLSNGLVVNMWSPNASSKSARVRVRFNVIRHVPYLPRVQFAFGLVGNQTDNISSSAVSSPPPSTSFAAPQRRRMRVQSGDGSVGITWDTTDSVTSSSVVESNVIVGFCSGLVIPSAQLRDGGTLTIRNNTIGDDLAVSLNSLQVGILLGNVEINNVSSLMVIDNVIASGTDFQYETSKRAIVIQLTRVVDGSSFVITRNVISLSYEAVASSFNDQVLAIYLQPTSYSAGNSVVLLDGQQTLFSITENTVVSAQGGIKCSDSGDLVLTIGTGAMLSISSNVMQLSPSYAPPSSFATFSASISLNTKTVMTAGATLLIFNNTLTSGYLHLLGGFPGSGNGFSTLSSTANVTIRGNTIQHAGRVACGTFAMQEWSVLDIDDNTFFNMGGVALSFDLVQTSATVRIRYNRITVATPSGISTGPTYAVALAADDAARSIRNGGSLRFECNTLDVTSGPDGAVGFFASRTRASSSPAVVTLTLSSYAGLVIARNTVVLRAHAAPVVASPLPLPVGLVAFLIDAINASDGSVASIAANNCTTLPPSVGLPFTPWSLPVSFLTTSGGMNAKGNSSITVYANVASLNATDVTTSEPSAVFWYAASGTSSLANNGTFALVDNTLIMNATLIAMANNAISTPLVQGLSMTLRCNLNIAALASGSPMSWLVTPPPDNAVNQFIPPPAAVAVWPPPTIFPCGTCHASVDCIVSPWLPVDLQSMTSAWTNVSAAPTPVGCLCDASQVVFCPVVTPDCSFAPPMSSQPASPGATSCAWIVPVPTAPPTLPPLTTQGPITAPPTLPPAPSPSTINCSSSGSGNSSSNSTAAGNCTTTMNATTTQVNGTIIAPNVTNVVWTPIIQQATALRTTLQSATGYFSMRDCSITDSVVIVVGSSSLQTVVIERCVLNNSMILLESASTGLQVVIQDNSVTTPAGGPPNFLGANYSPSVASTSLDAISNAVFAFALVVVQPSVEFRNNIIRVVAAVPPANAQFRVTSSAGLVVVAHTAARPTNQLRLNVRNNFIDSRSLNSGNAYGVRVASGSPMVASLVITDNSLAITASAWRNLTSAATISGRALVVDVGFAVEIGNANPADALTITGNTVLVNAELNPAAAFTLRGAFSLFGSTSVASVSSNSMTISSGLAVDTARATNAAAFRVMGNIALQNRSVLQFIGNSIVASGAGVSLISIAASVTLNGAAALAANSNQFQVSGFQRCVHVARGTAIDVNTSMQFNNNIVQRAEADQNPRDTALELTFETISLLNGATLTVSDNFLSANYSYTTSSVLQPKPVYGIRVYVDSLGSASVVTVAFNRIVGFLDIDRNDFTSPQPTYGIDARVIMTGRNASASIAQNLIVGGRSMGTAISLSLGAVNGGSTPNSTNGSRVDVQSNNVGIVATYGAGYAAAMARQLPAVMSRITGIGALIRQAMFVSCYGIGGGLQFNLEDNHIRSVAKGIVLEGHVMLGSIVLVKRNAVLLSPPAEGTGMSLTMSGTSSSVTCEDNTVDFTDVAVDDFGGGGANSFSQTSRITGMVFSIGAVTDGGAFQARRNRVTLNAISSSDTSVGWYFSSPLFGESSVLNGSFVHFENNVVTAPFAANGEQCSFNVNSGSAATWNGNVMVSTVPSGGGSAFTLAGVALSNNATFNITNETWAAGTVGVSRITLQHFSTLRISNCTGTNLNNFWLGLTATTYDGEPDLFPVWLTNASFIDLVGNQFGFLSTFTTIPVSIKLVSLAQSSHVRLLDNQWTNLPRPQASSTVTGGGSFPPCIAFASPALSVTNRSSVRVERNQVTLAPRIGNVADPYANDEKAPAIGFIGVVSVSYLSSVQLTANTLSGGAIAFFSDVIVSSQSLVVVRNQTIHDPYTAMTCQGNVLLNDSSIFDLAGNMLSVAQVSFRGYVTANNNSQFHVRWNSISVAAAISPIVFDVDLSHIPDRWQSYYHADDYASVFGSYVEVPTYGVIFHAVFNVTNGSALDVSCNNVTVTANAFGAVAFVFMGSFPLWVPQRFVETSTNLPTSLISQSSAFVINANNITIVDPVGASAGTMPSIPDNGWGLLAVYFKNAMLLTTNCIFVASFNSLLTVTTFSVLEVEEATTTTTEEPGSGSRSGSGGEDTPLPQPWWPGWDSWDRRGSIPPREVTRPRSRFDQEGFDFGPITASRNASWSLTGNVMNMSPMINPSSYPPPGSAACAKATAQGYCYPIRYPSAIPTLLYMRYFPLLPVANAGMVIAENTMVQNATLWSAAENPLYLIKWNYANTSQPVTLAIPSLRKIQVRCNVNAALLPLAGLPTMGNTWLAPAVPPTVAINRFTVLDWPQATNFSLQNPNAWSYIVDVVPCRVCIAQTDCVFANDAGFAWSTEWSAVSAAPSPQGCMCGGIPFCPVVAPSCDSVLPTISGATDPLVCSVPALAANATNVPAVQPGLQVVLEFTVNANATTFSASAFLTALAAQLGVNVADLTLESQLSTNDTQVILRIGFGDGAVGQSLANRAYDMPEASRVNLGIDSINLGSAAESTTPAAPDSHRARIAIIASSTLLVVGVAAAVIAVARRNARRRQVAMTCNVEDALFDEETSSASAGSPLTEEMKGPASA